VVQRAAYLHLAGIIYIYWSGHVVRAKAMRRMSYKNLQKLLNEKHVMMYTFALHDIETNLEY
jgi:hypothetical protein